MAPMIYKWKSGTPTCYEKFDAQVVGEELHTICAKHGPSVTAEILIEHARNVESDLHPLFEWDDTVAASKFRVNQAQEIASNIVVVQSRTEDREPVSSRISVRSFSDDDEEPEYTRHTQKMCEECLKGKHSCQLPGCPCVCNDPSYPLNLKKQEEDIVFNRAVEELNRWCSYYSGVKGLNEICSYLMTVCPRAKVESPAPSKIKNEPKSQVIVRQSTSTHKQEILGWCAVCLQDGDRVQAIIEIQGFPLCKPCKELFADDPSVVEALCGNP